MKGAAGIPDCSCLRLRRMSRCLTQLYDRILAPAGVTVSQLGLLAGLRHTAGAGLCLSALAAHLAMDHSTLNRKLKPLLARGLAANGMAHHDARLRVVRLTARGSTALARAMPLWRQAQDSLEQAIGRETTRSLNALLDLAAARVKRPSQR
jgi:DNA-binding MarR family transcriptional regulator